MTCEKVETAFDPPFCGEAEVQFWCDLTNRLAVAHETGVRSTGLEMEVSSGCGIGGKGWVIWKTRGNPDVGLVTSGPYAGWLVHRQRAVARPHRPLAIDGAEFETGRALERLETLAINPDLKVVLTIIVANEEGDYFPELIAACLISLGVPFDENTFLSNLHRANLRFRRPSSAAGFVSLSAF